MKKRILSVLIVITLIFMYSASAFAKTSYSELISGVLDDMSSNNARCEGAPQQSANGAYRFVEMLAIIAMSNDELGLYSDIIEGVLDDMRSNDARCSGAPQQTANGVYRAVEMLAIIAYE